ncbi:MFS transporter [Neorhizobium galegae]|uniref:MFS transporter n=1 Tax=Neorhizobium galegae TaxID=399 RepID=UPI000620E755|nr:MFS transporter [Neorhizobium galegae]MCQ1853361.1 MFS transporter [Neorhizobium galegae]CDZ53134.1 Drug resistance MFS transporter [Neorhizobium galegae bv. orientalis]
MSSVSAAPVVPISLLRSGVPAWIAAVVACLCSFMVVMDGAIVNVALPAIRADLGMSAIGQQWVVDAYLLSLGGFMLLAARASDVYGRRTILQAGLVTFTLASLVGGFATSGLMLLAARAVQGLGASALATSTLAVIISVYPKGAGRERAISFWAASGAIAAAFGVIIGGVLVSVLSWRWVMFVNAPIGALLSLVVATCLAPQPHGEDRLKLDMPGAISITLAIGSFIYGITQSVALGWGSPVVLGALGIAAGLLALFVGIESRTEQPLIRLSVFRHRNIPVGIVMVMGLGASLTASMFFISLVLQQIAGYSPMDTGLAILPMALLLAITSISSRYLRDAGFDRLPFFGGLMAAAGLVWLAWVPAAPVYVADILWPSLLVGGGLGLMIMTATHAVLAGIPHAQSGLAAGLQNTARQLGGAVGIAALVTLAHSVSVAESGTGSETFGQLAGYHAAFIATGAISAVSALASLLLRHDPS